MSKNNEYTITGTNITEVKRKNSEFGLTYNQVKELLSKQYQQQNISSLTRSINPQKQ